MKKYQFIKTHSIDFCLDIGGQYQKSIECQNSHSNRSFNTHLDEGSRRDTVKLRLPLISKFFLQPALKLLLIMTVALLVLSSGNAGAQAVGIPFLVSTNAQGTDSGNRSTFSQSSMTISKEGRYVTFSSAADDLVSNDTNGTVDVFVRDLEVGTTTLVSVDSTNNFSGNGPSNEPVISASGRYVAFRSTASNLVGTDTNGNFDVFVRDLLNKTSTLVSVNKLGADSGNGRSLAPSISADGLFVAFQSEATDITATDADGTRDIFRRDLQAGTTTLVSINPAGTASGNSNSFAGGINADGRFVVFISDATNLVVPDTNGQRDVFIRDLQNSTTELVSVNNTDTDSANASSTTRRTVPSISDDGNFVTFRSGASNLVTTDTNGLQDIFVRDRQNNTTTLVSLNSTGTDSGNGMSSNQVLSNDGRFVAFDSVASDLTVPNSSGVGDVFVRDLQNNKTTLVSVNQAGFGGGNLNSAVPVLSGDGRFVVFFSNATDLTNIPDSNGGLDTFVRDLQNNTTVLASVNTLLNSSGDRTSLGVPSISHDGRLVTFVSTANDLVAMDTNGNTADGFVQDLFAFVADSDGDGVSDVNDLCADTTMQESVPTVGLGTNRFALVDNDNIFDTTPSMGTGPKRNFTTTDTGGCSCEQIIDAQGLGNGHAKFGCSIGAMDNWVDLVRD